jgi:hypothetical protein
MLRRRHLEVRLAGSDPGRSSSASMPMLARARATLEAARNDNRTRAVIKTPRTPGSSSPERASSSQNSEARGAVNDPAGGGDGDAGTRRR